MLQEPCPDFNGGGRKKRQQSADCIMLFRKRQRAGPLQEHFADDQERRDNDSRRRRDSSGDSFCQTDTAENNMLFNRERANLRGKRHTKRSLSNLELYARPGSHTLLDGTDFAVWKNRRDA